MNYQDFLSNNSNIENNKLIDELNKYKKENQEMKNKINLLLNENMKLKNDLAQANIIIINKGNEINNLKLQLQQLQNKNNINVNYNDIIFVHFISSDQKINCPIKCLKTETFAEVEEKLYQKYEEYREKNNNFIGNGRLILRFKKIYENNIKDGDKVQLLDDYILNK